MCLVAELKKNLDAARSGWQADKRLLQDAKRNDSDLQSKITTMREHLRSIEAQSADERDRLQGIVADARASAQSALNRALTAEAGQSSLEVSLATLSRTYHYYARQLAMLSRQHASWVSAVSLPELSGLSISSLNGRRASSPNSGANMLADPELVAAASSGVSHIEAEPRVEELLLVLALRQDMQVR